MGDAAQAIMEYQGEGFLQQGVHAVGVVIPASHGVAKQLTGCIQQHKVRGPGVDTDAHGREALGVGGLQACDHMCFQGCDIPAETAVFHFCAVWEAVDLPGHDAAILQPGSDVPPAGGSDVNGKINVHSISLHQILAGRFRRFLYSRASLRISSVSIRKVSPCP